MESRGPFSVGAELIYTNVSVSAGAGVDVVVFVVGIASWALLLVAAPKTSTCMGSTVTLAIPISNALSLLI